MILAGTGHRPDKIIVAGKNAYEDTVARGLVDFALLCLEREATELVISGMALGWDQALAQACVECGIPFVAAVPFGGQESRWPAKARKTYHWLLGQAAEVRYLAPSGYAPQKMIARNVWMVDHADRILALWDGSDGGTAHAVGYAERVGKPVTNVWAEWGRFTMQARSA